MVSVKGTGSKDPSVVQINLTVDEEEADDTRNDELARFLLKELRDFGVDSVERRTAGILPPGSKAGEAIDLGSLVLTLAPSLLSALIGFLKNWVQRGDRRTIKLATSTGVEIEITADKEWGAEELARLVEKITTSQSPSTKGE